ncbi:MAG: DsbA family protein, partial [Gemmatimonadota bacterium]
LRYGKALREGATELRYGTALRNCAHGLAAHHLRLASSASCAREIGVDVAQYESCYREDRGKARTRRNNSVARELRVRATPTFFINGRIVQGAPPFELFRALLENAAGNR